MACAGKLDFVDKFPVPKNDKELNSFLGFTNYLKKFVKDFSIIADPLFKIRNVKTFVWSKKEEKTFQELKLAIKSGVQAFTIGIQRFYCRHGCIGGRYGRSIVSSSGW